MTRKSSVFVGLNPAGYGDLKGFETLAATNALLGADMLTPVAKLAETGRGLDTIMGLTAPKLATALIDVDGVRRTALGTAAGAWVTTTGEYKVAAGALSALTADREAVAKSLAQLAGVNAQIDVVQNIAALTGIPSLQLADAALNANATINDAMKRILNIDILGEEWRKRLEGYTSGLGSHLQGYMDTIDRLRDAREKVAEGSTRFVERHGWPLPLGLPPGDLEPLVTLAGKGRLVVRRAMVRAFAPGTQVFLYTREALMDSYSFESRRRPIEQALRAMHRKDYYAAICTMLPLTEGVLVDAAFTPTTAPSKKPVHRALSELADPGSVEETWALQMIEAVLLSGAGGVALFGDFERRDYGIRGESRQLNRHAILHGSARRYGSLENSLKLFLLLAALADTLDLVEVARRSAG